MLAHEVAAEIIGKLSEKKHTVKSLVLSSKFRNIKQLYALVCETLKYRQVLEKIIDSTKLLKRERNLCQKTKAFTIVLLYDFLFGKGLQAAGKWKACILNHKAALNAELARIKIKSGAVTNQDLIPEEVQKASVVLPRYVRVNTIRADVAWVKRQFVAEGYREVVNPGNSHESFMEAVRNLLPKQFTEDLHVKNVLVFSAGTDLHNFWLHKSGHIILQDKASCFPSYILSPPAGSHVIDCCAAPGNKTSHMAAIMQNKGKIFAFDLDPRRLRTMQKLCRIAGATNIDYKHQDFLTVDTNDEKYADVEYILVDPSCSGSGIASRLNSLTDDEKSSSKDRLENLAKFQKSIVKHALCFPNVKAVTYSTCSIHPEENEAVVKDVLKDFGGKFHLRYVLPDWTHRGVGGDDVGASCIRASPQVDLTNGFFVACFLRTLPDSPEILIPGSSLESGVCATKDVCPVDSNVVEIVVKSKKKKRKKKKKTTSSLGNCAGRDICENGAGQSVDVRSVTFAKVSAETTGLSCQGVENILGKKRKSSTQDTAGLVMSGTGHQTDKSYEKVAESKTSCMEVGTHVGLSNVPLTGTSDAGSKNGCKRRKVSSPQGGARLDVDGSGVVKSCEKSLQRSAKRKKCRQRAKQRKKALWDGAGVGLEGSRDKSCKEDVVLREVDETSGKIGESSLKVV
ncbi:28S rRNA (cytosine-C(5))-methyltransferase-like [Lineus longissimus]|uniref:28S rRNA (cytosine-C(5))-methyltransferase-like n=1 Tax=Lineus longissimus TaxID=88925 RepID=UPI00315DC91B